MPPFWTPPDIVRLNPTQVFPDVDAEGNPANPADLQAQMAIDIHTLASLRTITTGIISRSVTVTGNATQIILAQADQGFTLINPTPSIGLTSSGIFYPATNISGAGGNTQASPLGVSNYDSLHLYVNIANAAGLSINLIAQTISPINGTWIDVQDVNGGTAIVANSDGYFALGNFGVTTQFAMRWIVNSGTCTLTLGYVLKGGLGGSPNGIANTVYLGNTGVTRQAGYPILEGQFRDFYLKENAQLWGVTGGATVTLNVIELD